MVGLPQERIAEPRANRHTVGGTITRPIDLPRRSGKPARDHGLGMRLPAEFEFPFGRRSPLRPGRRWRTGFRRLREWRTAKWRVERRTRSWSGRVQRHGLQAEWGRFKISILCTPRALGSAPAQFSAIYPG